MGQGLSYNYNHSTSLFRARCSGSNRFAQQIVLFLLFSQLHFFKNGKKMERADSRRAPLTLPWEFHILDPKARFESLATVNSERVGRHRTAEG